MLHLPPERRASYPLHGLQALGPPPVLGTGPYSVSHPNLALPHVYGRRLPVQPALLHEFTHGHSSLHDSQGIAKTHKGYANACNAFHDVADFIGLSLSRYEPIPHGTIQLVLSAAANPPFNLSVGTLKNWVSALRHTAAHGNLAFPDDYVDLSMTMTGLDLSQRANPSKGKAAYTREDVRGIFALDRSDFRVLQPVTLFMLQLLCGLRGAEATNLRCWHVKLHRNHVSVFIHKSKRDRKHKGFMYYLPHTTSHGIPVYDIMSAFLGHTGTIRNNRRSYLFSAKQDGAARLSYATHTRWFSKLHTCAKIDPRGKTTHSPRITCQTFLTAGKAMPDYVLYHLRRARKKANTTYVPIYPVKDDLAEVAKHF